MLLELNLWASAGAPSLDAQRSTSAAHPLAKSRRSAARMRAASGYRAWNAWAAAMRAIRQQINEDLEDLILWRDLATADFAGVDFQENCDFTGFVFPGPTDFSDAHFADRKSVV